INGQSGSQSYDLAILYLQRGKNAMLMNKGSEALSDLNTALRLIKSGDDPSLEILFIDVELALAELLLSQNKPLAAIKKLRAISQSLITDLTDKEMAVCQKLYRAYKELGRTDSALYFLEAYEEARKRSIKEEILKESKHEMTRDRISLEITEKEVLENQNKQLIQSQKEERRRRDDRENLIFKIASVLGFLVLIVVIYLLYMRYQIQTKSHEELSTRKLEMEVQNKKLRHSNEALEQFAYAASHDMLEPLRMIGNYTSLIEHKFKDKLETDAIEFLGYISDAVKRMRRLLTELLEYSRVSNSDLEFKKVSLNELISSILRTLSYPIKEKEAIILVDDLPEIVGNETQLFQVFQNFLSNALKFSKDKNPNIEIGSYTEGNGNVIYVKDNGIGIAKEHYDKIFNLFQRLHSRDTIPGTGIGLAINKRIMDNHQGEIWLESEEGEGTTFFVKFPFNLPVTS
ncbi:MAG: ATP-binding protein, partial [Bacteroidota bacterium]